jgi:hypothetical protein
LPTTPATNNSNSGFGKAFGKDIPTMGQLVVPMSRTNYKGSSSNTSNNTLYSHIIGSAISDNQMFASPKWHLN